MGLEMSSEGLLRMLEILTGPDVARGFCLAGTSEIPNSVRTEKYFSLGWSCRGDIYTWISVAWSQQKKGVNLDFPKWAQEELLTTTLFNLNLFSWALTFALFALKISFHNSQHPFFLWVQREGCYPKLCFSSRSASLHQQAQGRAQHCVALTNHTEHRARDLGVRVHASTRGC